MRSNQFLEKSEVQAWMNKAIAIGLIDSNGLDITIARKLDNMIFSQSRRDYPSFKKRIN